MLIVIFMLIFVAENIWFCKRIDRIEAQRHNYDTKFCHGARASLGMFAYKSDVEDARYWLNAQDKF